MIEVNEFPKNKAHVRQLLDFTREVFAHCSALEINPILYASLGVFVYTRNTEMVVNDVDVLIPEEKFPALIDTLNKQGISCELKPYHVVQVKRDDLQIEFDALVHWTNVWEITVANTPEIVRFEGLDIHIMSLDNLIQTYRVGVTHSQNRSENYRVKLQMLEQVQNS